MDDNRISGNDRRECPYFQQLSDLYGYRPNVTPIANCSSSGNGHARRETTTTVVVGGEEIPLDIPDDDNDQEVPLKDFEENASSCSWAADGSDDSHSESVKPSRKRKYTSGAAVTAQLMVSWLDGYKQEKRKTEEEKIKKVETMHNEKMSLLKDLINILKKN